MPSKLPINLADLLRQRTVETNSLRWSAFTGKVRLQPDDAEAES